jgi:hypothetical protein
MPTREAIVDLDEESRLRCAARKESRTRQLSSLSSPVPLTDVRTDADPDVESGDCRWRNGTIVADGVEILRVQD